MDNYTISKVTANYFEVIRAIEKVSDQYLNALQFDLGEKKADEIFSEQVAEFEALKNLVGDSMKNAIITKASYREVKEI